MGSLQFSTGRRSTATKKKSCIFKFWDYEIFYIWSWKVQSMSTIVLFSVDINQTAIFLVNVYQATVFYLVDGWHPVDVHFYCTFHHARGTWERRSKRYFYFLWLMVRGWVKNAHNFLHSISIYSLNKFKENLKKSQLACSLIWNMGTEIIRC